MVKTSLHISLKFILELALACSVIVFILLGALAWKLHQGPIDLSNIATYLEQQFNKNSSEEKIDIGTLYLEWQGVENPLGLKANNVFVRNSRGPFLYSPQVDMNISLRSLLFGHLRFEAVWIRRIALSITRQMDGTISMTGTPKSETQNIAEPEQTLEAVPANITLTNFIYDLPDIDMLWIEGARIIYNDKQNDKTQKYDPVTIFIQSLDQRDRRTLSGYIQFPFGDLKNKTNTATMRFTSAENPARLKLQAKLEQTPINNILQFVPFQFPEDLAIDATLDSRLNIELDNGFNLYSLDWGMSADTADIIVPMNDGTQTYTISQFESSIHHQPKTNVTRIDYIKAQLGDNGLVTLSGTFSHALTNTPLSGTISAKLESITPQHLKTYWPTAYTNNGAYSWLVNKISNGTFDTVNINAEFDTGKTSRSDTLPLPAAIISVTGDMTYHDLTIDYNTPMAKAQNVKGSAQYNNVTLDLAIDEATIGGMTTKNATLHFDDLISSGKGLGTLTFPIQSDIQPVFDYIAAKPISAFDNVDFNPKNTTGIADVIATVKIPLLKDVPIDDIDVHVKGTLNDVTINNALKGLDVSGGPFEIEATTRDIKLSGNGQLSGQPITFDWHEYFTTNSAKDYLSKINATVTGNQNIIRAFAGDFASSFDGNIPTTLTYLKQTNGKQTNLSLTLDLKDASMDIADIGLTKPKGQSGNASMDITLNNGYLRSIDKLNLSGDAFAVQNGSLKFSGTNDNLKIESVILKNARYNKNNASIILAHQDGYRKINVTGKYLDARPFLSGEKQESTDTNETTAKTVSTETAPDLISIQVDELQMANDETTLKNVEATMEISGGSPKDIDLKANLGPKGQAGQFRIAYDPSTHEKYTLRIQSDNAGEALRAFDLYPHIQGGSLTIAGRPLKGGRYGDVSGHARIDDFKVSGAPIFLRLINALSFQNFMEAGALSFKRLESDFEWKLSDNGDIYTIRDGSTSGASIALTFDGYVDTIKNDLKINGTAAPLSEVNNLVAKIPVIGQILTGGEALLAATYSISGQPSDPSINVNPLSFLAPGILRKLLFESTPEADTIISEDGSTTDKK